MVESERDMDTSEENCPKLEKQKKAILALAVADTVGIVLNKIQKSRLLQMLHVEVPWGIAIPRASGLRPPTPSSQSGDYTWSL